MSMVLEPEHVHVIGRVDYKGAAKYEAKSDIVLIHGNVTGQIAMALRFDCNPFATALLRNERNQDPCDKEFLDKYVSDLIATAAHYPFFGFLEDSVFTDLNILEGDDRWVFSYGYGTFDKSLYQRYLFGHPTDESVDTGEYGKQLLFNYRHGEMFLEINTSRGDDQALDTDD